jgi:hypothetical protein
LAPDSSGGRSNNFVLTIAANSGSSATVQEINSGSSATINSGASATIEDRTVVPAPPNSGTSATEQWHQRHPNISKNEKGMERETDSTALIIEGSLAKKRSSTEHFDTFWQVYPKRIGRLAAQRAFDKAVEAGADPIAIIDGARRYASQRTGEPERYTKHPANWLSGGHWNDEPPVSQGSVVTIDQHGNQIATPAPARAAKRTFSEVAAETYGEVFQ